MKRDGVRRKDHLRGAVWLWSKLWATWTHSYWVLRNHVEGATEGSHKGDMFPVTPIPFGWQSSVVFTFHTSRLHLLVG